jgi:hypothetical protein
MDKTLLATACLLSVLSASAQVPADLILIHGKILTVDAKDSIAQAVAIRQGKINRVQRAAAKLKPGQWLTGA